MKEKRTKEDATFNIKT